MAAQYPPARLARGSRGRLRRVRRLWSVSRSVIVVTTLVVLVALGVSVLALALI